MGYLLLTDPGKSQSLPWIRDIALAYDHSACLIWPFGRTRDGYGLFGKDGKSYKAHRFICALVNGEPPDPSYHAAHSCGRGADGCVNPKHLSWKTPSENFKEGEKHRRRKLNAEQVIEIRRLKDLERVQDVAARFGVTECNIRKIQAGKLWRQPRRCDHDFTDDQVREIRLLRRGESDGAAERFGCHVSMIQRIRSRKAYAEVPDIAAE